MVQTKVIIGGIVFLLIAAGVLYVYSGPTLSVNQPVVKEATLKVESPSGEISTPPIPVVDSTQPTAKGETKPSLPPVQTKTPLLTNENKKVEPETSVAIAATMAILKTSMGNITVKFYPKDAPKAVENFIKLSREKFYDGVKFHRVMKGFMIQGGDPLTKDDSQMARWGTGGPGYKFADEINPGSALYQKGYKRGVLAMANSGPNTNGSQFFIMHQDYPLDPLYVIFGEVTEGLLVVDKIAETKTDGPTNLGGHDRPILPVIISGVELQ